MARNRLTLLPQVLAAHNRRPTKVERAGNVASTFGQMLTGQIKPGHGDGGFMGLHAPMGYSTFLFAFVIFPILAYFAFL